MPMEIIEPIDGQIAGPFGTRLGPAQFCPWCHDTVDHNELCSCYPPIRWDVFTDNELKGYRYIGD